MSLTTVNAGDTFYPSVLNQLIDVLKREAGQQETGHYLIAGNSYTATGLYLSCYSITRSRNATPVSASVDTADQSMVNLGSPSVGHITQGGAQVYAAASAANGNDYGGGNITFQF